MYVHSEVISISNQLPGAGAVVVVTTVVVVLAVVGHVDYVKTRYERDKKKLRNPEQKKIKDDLSMTHVLCLP